MSTRVDAFVVAGPGLEPLVLDEVRKLGVRPARAVKGGVECTVTWPQLWAIHLRSRVATRVLVRVARFGADGFGTLEAGLRRIDWPAWLDRSTGVTVQASCDKASALYHSGAVEERVTAALDRPPGDQTVMVRVLDDVVTISLDASGDSLYRRGWRGAAGKAPMRETLAAALVLASGWDVRRPLVDPFCGSGTIPIEAAMIARRMAPGRHRTFAFMDWPSFDRDGWDRLVRGADGDVIDRCPPILATDRDEGAVAATIANAETAGVSANVTAERRTISDLALPARPGWLVTNPPYGRRVGDHDVRDLYDRWGAVLAERAACWHLAVLAPDDAPLSRLRVPFEPVLRTSNGGIPVAVRVASQV